MPEWQPGKPFQLAADDDLARAIQDAIVATDIAPESGFEGRHPLSGHCATATQAYMWLAGGQTPESRKRMRLHARVLKYRRLLKRGVDHWFLEDDTSGHFIDVTREQFPQPGKLRYSKSKRRWWQHFPSAKADRVIKHVERHHPEAVTRAE